MIEPTIIQVKGNQFEVSGDIDFESAPMLLQKGINLFSSVDENVLQVDLSGIASANSAGVAVLLAWMRYVHAQQKKIIYQQLPQSLKSIAGASNLEKILEG